MNYFNEKSHLNINDNIKGIYEQPKGEKPLKYKAKKQFKQLIQGKGSWLNTKKILRSGEWRHRDMTKIQHKKFKMEDNMKDEIGEGVDGCYCAPWMLKKIVLWNSKKVQFNSI